MGVSSDSVTIPVTFTSDVTTLSIFSQALGVVNYGEHYESQINDGLSAGKVLRNS